MVRVVRQKVLVVDVEEESRGNMPLPLPSFSKTSSISTKAVKASKVFCCIKKERQKPAAAAATTTGHRLKLRGGL